MEISPKGWINPRHVEGTKQQTGHTVDLCKNGEVHNCFGEVGANRFVELKK